MDLSAHTSLAPLAEAVAAVLRPAAAAGLEVYIAGALARDLWLEFAYGINAGRRTADVDFAVECSDWAAFESLRVALVAAGQLVQSDRAHHKFHHRNGTELDLLPYGGVERADRTLAWPPGGLPGMNALGFAEVASTTVLFLLPGGVRVKVVALHALALLKLVAWTDRCLQKDAHDLFVIARHYLDAGQVDRLYATAMDLVMRNDFDYEVASAELLGRDLAALDRGDGVLRGFAITLLQHETEPHGVHLLISQMTRTARDAGLPLRLLLGVWRGIEAAEARS